MALVPCPRCSGYMMQEFGSETYCLMCGHCDYGKKVLQPADVERIAATHANRELRRASTWQPGRNHPWRNPNRVWYNS